jgi:hypothetical protein
LAGGVWEESPNPNGYIWYIAFSEMAVHSTIAISNESTITFDGLYENDPYQTVDSTPYVNDCALPNDEYPCFRALEEGWFKADFGLTFIESIRMTYPDE